jgi:putative Ca2+/H+ antiporter (TMEM165/GDT1 family)
MNYSQMQLNLISGFTKNYAQWLFCLVTTAYVSIFLGEIKDKFQMTILQMIPKTESTESFGKGTTLSLSITLG